MSAQHTLFARIIMILLLCACTKRPEKQQAATDVPKPAQQAPLPAPRLNIRYHIVANDYRQFDSLFTAEQAAVILPLNRIDRRALRRKDSLLLPDTFINDWNAYSPFPQRLSTLDSIDKILLFSYPVQAFAAYEKGRLAIWGPSSLGKKSSPTDTGLFHCNWRAKSTISTVNDEWKLNWYVNIENKSGVSMHEYELPGYPASHACTRLSEKDAKWVYDWIDQWKLSPNGQQVEWYGTPVCVFGTYDFKNNLLANITQNQQPVTHSEAQLESILQAYLPAIMQRQADKKRLHAMESGTADSISQENP